NTVAPTAIPFNRLQIIPVSNELTPWALTDVTLSLPIIPMETIFTANCKTFSIIIGNIIKNILFLIVLLSIILSLIALSISLILTILKFYFYTHSIQLVLSY